MKHFCSTKCQHVTKLEQHEYDKVTAENRRTRDELQRVYGSGVRRLARSLSKHMLSSTTMATPTAASTNDDTPSTSTIVAGEQRRRMQYTIDQQQQQQQQQYAMQMSTALDNQQLLLQLLEATKQHASNRWQQASDLAQCQLLKTLVRLCRAKNVLELGTFTGMATISMAEAASGTVVTCDSDASMVQVARQFIAQSSVAERIQTWSMPAEQALEHAAEQQLQFDVVLIDADKRRNLQYYQTLRDKRLLSSDAVVLVDNTLFRGLVAQREHAAEVAERDKKTADRVRDFNTAIAKDSNTAYVQILPLRDGLSIIQPGAAKPMAPSATERNK
jgi:predicted O-methyltransferase YrrM